jgi:hypothetical protein
LVVQDNNSTFNVSMKFDDLTLAIICAIFGFSKGFHLIGYNGL